MKFPWLTNLLDTYHIFETGLHIELEAEEARRATRIACGHGCVSCCLRPTVPATELELMGIWWFVQYNLDSETRQRVSSRLEEGKELQECVFLLEKSCVIYTMRPLACRILNVFGTRCNEYEIIAETRSKDIWTPGREVVLKAAMPMLEYFGFKYTRDKAQAFDEGFVPGNSRVLKDVDWSKVIAFWQQN